MRVWASWQPKELVDRHCSLNQLKELVDRHSSLKLCPFWPVAFSVRLIQSTVLPIPKDCWEEKVEMGKSTLG